MQGLAIIRWKPEDLLPVFLSYNDKGELGIIPAYCCDCRESEGVLEKPDYWID